MKENKKIAISVFCVAFSFGLSITGISPILGVLCEEYSDWNLSVVQSLQTIQYLFLMVGSLCLSWLTTKISKKKIILAGLMIVGICGITPFFTDSFYVLYLCRVLIGLGFGVIGPINTAVISEFIPENDRASFMGLHVVGMGIGTLFGNLIGGFLTGFGYKYFYFIYCFAFISAIGIAIFLKETAPVSKTQVSQIKIGGTVYALSLISFVHTLFINSYSMNIGIYTMNKISQDPSFTGFIIAINAVAALTVGITFSRIYKLFKNYTMIFAVSAATAGFASIIFLPPVAGVVLGSILCGVSLSCFMAYASFLISVSVEKEAVAKASGMFSIIGGIGGLIAPFILGKLSFNILGSNSADNQFFISLWGMLILSIIIIALTIKGRQKTAQAL